MAISGKAKVAGIMGWPVGHSKSPVLHGFWLSEYGIDGAYVPMAVAPENLKTALKALSSFGFRGVNLTVPHKEAALTIVDEVTPEGRAVGAINTVFVLPDGRLQGTNTDAYGFIENLRQGSVGFEAKRGPAVVLGAGGAARAVCAALIQAGTPEIRLLNRTLARAETLARDFGKTVTPMAWADAAKAMSDAALLVNSTSLGMTGQPVLDVSLDTLPASAVVTDLVYAPLETPLLAAAKKRGNKTVDGLGMLLYQAQKGFEGWFGVTPAVTPALRKHLLSL
ncbi:MAG: shikimate dehydrogenase [Rhodospirillaceae bacterium]|nr:shikimate dehydrogenase [Rhodospirillaceae bacterium]